MGLKANVCFLKDFEDATDEDLLINLDLPFEVKRKSSLEKQIYTQKNLSIGEYKGIKMICHSYYPIMGFDSMEISEFEERLLYIYKPELILCVGLQSSMNVYGYSLIQGGIKSRVNSGSIQGKLFEDGEITSEEKLIYSNYDFHKDKNLYFSKDGKKFGGEDMFGEELVMSLSRRFFDAPLNQLDLSKIIMRPYLILE